MRFKIIYLIFITKDVSTIWLQQLIQIP